VVVISTERKPQRKRPGTQFARLEEGEKAETQAPVSSFVSHCDWGER
jgi:hypothetical protein